MPDGMTCFGNIPPWSNFLQQLPNDARFSALPIVTQRTLLDLLTNASPGPQTVFQSQIDTYYLSLADQILTLAPPSLVTDIIGYANTTWQDDCLQVFAQALTNRQASFVPAQNEPTLTTVDITGRGLVQPVAPSDVGSQQLVLPVAELTYPGSSSTGAPAIFTPEQLAVPGQIIPQALQSIKPTGTVQDQPYITPQSQLIPQATTQQATTQSIDQTTQQQSGLLFGIDSNSLMIIAIGAILLLMSKR